MLFRPTLKITPPKVHGSVVKLPIANKNLLFSIHNLKMETAIVIQRLTYHLELDQFEFMMLPKCRRSKNDSGRRYERVFRSSKLTNHTMSLLNTTDESILFRLLEDENAFLRVRVHATHGLTGFAKGFEKCFKYSDNEFKEVRCQ